MADAKTVQQSSCELSGPRQDPIKYIVTTRLLKRGTPSGCHFKRTRRVHIHVSKLAWVVSNTEFMKFYWDEPELRGDWFDRFVRQFTFVLLGETICLEGKGFGHDCIGSGWHCPPVRIARAMLEYLS